MQRNAFNINYIEAPEPHNDAMALDRGVADLALLADGDQVATHDSYGRTTPCEYMN